MCIAEINGISVYQSEKLKKYGNLVHGFTLRSGGVSTGEYESLSLSVKRGDSIENVRKNESILCESLALDVKRLTSTRQEHTDNVRIIGDSDIGMGVNTPWEYGVDGCVTMLKNVPLICYSADCVPILMYASDIEAIAAVHSGWRGTKAEIAGKTVTVLRALGAMPKNITVAIGPCIGKCCYEVGSDVALNFSQKCRSSKENGKYMLDLAAANIEIMTKCGIDAENISVSEFCTKCRNDLFFSHRGQNGKSGVLGGIICMKD